MTNGLIIVAPSPWYDKHQGYAYTGHHYRWVAAPGDVPATPARACVSMAAQHDWQGQECHKGQKKAKKMPDRTASPKRTKPANGGRWGHEIVELVLPFAIPIQQVELQLSSRIRPHISADPEPCQMCLPIRTTCKPNVKVEVHTSQNCYATWTRGAPW